MPIKILSKLWYNNSESDSDSDSHSEYKYFSMKNAQKNDRNKQKNTDPRSPRKKRTPIKK